MRIPWQLVSISGFRPGWRTSGRLNRLARTERKVPDVRTRTRASRKPDTFPEKDVEFGSGPKYSCAAGGCRKEHGGRVKSSIGGRSGGQAAESESEIQMMRIDGLQYANWSERIFRQMRSGELSAVHVTVAYHEGFRETITNLEDWNWRFEQFPELICKGQWAADIDCARKSGLTAIFFGAQNSSPIESDIGLIEILHTLGLRFMQLTYNNQSLLASGCYEADDGGVTRMGRQAIKEMNRVGLVIDMSHSGPRSTIEAADLSQRPITISHANPLEWSPSLRNKNDDVIRAVTGTAESWGFRSIPTISGAVPPVRSIPFAE